MFEQYLLSRVEVSVLYNVARHSAQNLQLVDASRTRSAFAVRAQHKKIKLDYRTVLNWT